VPDDPEQTPGREDADEEAKFRWGPELFRSLVQYLFLVTRQVLSPVVLLGFGVLGVVLVLGFTWLLDPTDRLTALTLAQSLLDAMAEIASSQLVSVGGYLLTGVSWLALGIIIAFQNRRIRQQGAHNAFLRKLVDPKRISSTDAKKLEEYGINLVERSRGLKDPGDKIDSPQRVRVDERRDSQAGTPANKERAKRKNRAKKGR